MILLCQTERISSFLRSAVQKSIWSMLLKHKNMIFIDSGWKVQISVLSNSFWSGNNHSKCKNQNTTLKFGFCKTYALAQCFSCPLRHDFAEIKENRRSLLHLEWLFPLLIDSPILQKPFSSETVIRTYFLKQKRQRFVDFWGNLQKVSFWTHFGVGISTPNAKSNIKHQFWDFAKPML